jgi:hypothetical protein
LFSGLDLTSLIAQLRRFGITLLPAIANHHFLTNFGTVIVKNLFENWAVITSTSVAQKPPQNA